MIQIRRKVGWKQILAKLRRLAPGGTNFTNRNPSDFHIEGVKFCAQPPSTPRRLWRYGDEIVRRGVADGRGENEKQQCVQDTLQLRPRSQAAGAQGALARRRAHSGAIPASFTTFAHLTISAATKDCSSSGVLVSGVIASALFIRSWISGLRRWLIS